MKRLRIKPCENRKRDTVPFPFTLKFLLQVSWLYKEPFTPIWHSHSASQFSLVKCQEADRNSLLAKWYFLKKFFIHIYVDLRYSSIHISRKMQCKHKYDHQEMVALWMLKKSQSTRSALQLQPSMRISVTWFLKICPVWSNKQKSIS